MKNNVIFTKLNNFKSPWIFGDFSESVLRTKDFEVGFFFLKRGDKSIPHKHLKCIEYNVIITGECLVTSNAIKHKLRAGDIFIFEKGVPSYVEYTADTTLVVIKTPSIPMDKVFITKDDAEG